MYIGEEYETKEMIHKGQMSTVYTGRNCRTGEPVIIKMSPDTADRVAQSSIHREIELLTKISHKDIPRLYGVYKAGSQTAAVLEKKEGKTLKELLKEGFRPDIREIKKIGLQLCEVLLYLHNRENPIIHRDIKPENILYKERVSLIDFGASREYNRGNSADTVFLGTIGFAAPEQFGGGAQSDERTDIYGFGMTFRRLAEGMERRNRKLAGIIERCTRTNPQERYQCIEELMAALYGLDRLFGAPKRIVAVTVLHTDVRL